MTKLVPEKYGLKSQSYRRGKYGLKCKIVTRIKAFFQLGDYFQKNLLKMSVDKTRVQALWTANSNVTAFLVSPLNTFYYLTDKNSK